MIPLIPPQPPKKTLWQKIGLYWTAIRYRIRAETPLFFQTINGIANAILGIAVTTQPDLLDLINTWLATGLHPLPWLKTLSTILAGIGLGAKFVAKLTANLATLSKGRIEKINPTQPEIAEELRS